jgi:hypothetical protein
MTTPRSKPLSAAARNAAYRDRMRAQGLRQVQMWVPDLKKASTLKRYQNAAVAISAHQQEEDDIMAFVEATIDWSDI